MGSKYNKIKQVLISCSWPYVLITITAIVLTACSDNPVGEEEEIVDSVRISGDDSILGIGGTLQFNATPINTSGTTVSTATVRWMSTDASVVTVNASGLVTSVGHGVATVTATAGNRSNGIRVTVHGSGDFKYRSSGGISISSRLTLPSGTGPFPAIVAVSGSEASRKESYQIPSANQRGFAVLSYDKRGVGESTGVCPCAAGVPVSAGNSKEMFQLLADDVLAGVDFLKRHNDIDSTKIGLIGWSQAGWIIPLAASRSEDIAFMVNVVGPTVTVGEEIYYSSLTGDSGAGPLPEGRTFEEIYDLVGEFSGTEGFDPIPILRRVDIPGLWQLGGMDRSIPTPMTIARIEALVDELGKPFEIKLYPNGNHGLVDVTTGLQIPYLSMPGGGIDWMLSHVNPSE